MRLSYQHQDVREATYKHYNTSTNKMDVMGPIALEAMSETWMSTIGEKKQIYGLSRHAVGSVP